MRQGQITEAWRTIRWWYKTAAPQSSASSPKSLLKQTQEYRNLYAGPNINNFQDTTNDRNLVPIDRITQNLTTHHAQTVEPPSMDELITTIQHLKNSDAKTLYGLSTNIIKSWIPSPPENPSLDNNNTPHKRWTQLCNLIDTIFT